MSRIFVNLSYTLTFALSVLLLLGCGNQSSNSNANDYSAESEQQAESMVSTESINKSSVTLDGIEQFVSWGVGAMKVSKDGDNFVLKTDSAYFTLNLKPTRNGIFQEVSPTQQSIGHGEKFFVEKIGDVTTLTAYHDKMIVLTLISNNNLKEYRNKGYHRILTSNFEPTNSGLVTFTDNKIKGSIFPDITEMDYFFIEDGNADLTDKIRLSPGRFHLSIAPADKGVNLHYCSINPQTGELDVQYGKDNTIILRYAQDPGWEWLSTDVLDTDFLIYNFEKPSWQLMLYKLNAKSGQLNAVEQWNKKLLENLIAYNEPYTGLESTDN